MNDSQKQGGLRSIRPSVISLIGGLMLLGSWVAQNTLYEYWNGRLSDLQRVESLYLSALSTTYVMDAMSASGIAPGEKEELQIVHYRDTNLRLAYETMAAGLSAQQKERFDKEIYNARDVVTLDKVGDRLIAEFSTQRKSIERLRSASRWLFFSAYMIGSVLLVVAEVLKSG